MVTCMAYTIVAACFILQLRRIGQYVSCIDKDPIKVSISTFRKVTVSNSYFILLSEISYILIKYTYFNFNIKIRRQIKKVNVDETINSSFFDWRPNCEWYLAIKYKKFLPLMFLPNFIQRVCLSANYRRKLGSQPKKPIENWTKSRIY